MSTFKIVNERLAKDLLEVLDQLSGLHAGHRPAHAKGMMCAGTFQPAPGASRLTRAPHATRSTPVIARFSNGTGLPTIPDNDPAKSGPRGFALRFVLGDHEHTDLIGHSHDGFPVRTGEEFLEFLRCAVAAGKGDAKPMGAFLASHPNAARFVQAAKPIPSSFARERFFGINAFAFTNAEGVTRHGRFRITPQAGVEHLANEAALARSPNFLFDELRERLAREPISYDIAVQLAEPGDPVDDASATWADGRPLHPFGTFTLTGVLDAAQPVHRRVIFDPDPRIDGIAAADVLTPARADLYLLSGRRRRAHHGDVRK